MAEEVCATSIKEAMCGVATALYFHVALSSVAETLLASK